MSYVRKLVIPSHIEFGRRDALRSFSRMLGNVLPVSRAFFDDLSVLDNMELEGAFLLDFSVTGNISRDQVSTSDYGDIVVNALVNELKVAASFGTVIPFSLNLPVVVPGRSTVLSFILADGSIAADFFVNNLNPINVMELFASDQGTPSLDLEYGGTLLARLPLTVGSSEVNLGVGEFTQLRNPAPNSILLIM